MRTNTKKLKCTRPKHPMPSEPEKDILLVISTDTMGKEEEIGKILIKGFFETMKVTKEIPHTIFFLNAGVKLTTINDEIIQVLKEIESLGAEIYSCGTCLKYYNLESKLKVGHRGTTSHVVEGIKDFRKVVWI
jgi:selenium metabolism protein YedF